ACPACESSMQPGLCERCEARRSAQVGEGLGLGSLVGGAFRVVATNARVLFPLAIIDALISTGLEAPKWEGIGALALRLISVVVSLAIDAAWILLISSSARGEPMSVGAVLRKGFIFIGALF